MILWAFSDTHGDLDALKKHLQRDADIILCAGDVTRMREEIEEVRALILGKQGFFCVPGNNELPEDIPEDVNIHGKTVNVDGYTVGGIGGSPGNVGVFTWDEEYARRLLEAIGSVDILLSHAPPAGTRCSLSLFGDLGSTAIREYVEDYQPKLVICGHVHERWGTEDRIGKTRVINVGPGGVEVRLE